MSLSWWKLRQDVLSSQKYKTFLVQYHVITSLKWIRETDQNPYRCVAVGSLGSFPCLQSWKSEDLSFALFVCLICLLEFVIAFLRANLVRQTFNDYLWPCHLYIISTTATTIRKYMFKDWTIWIIAIILILTPASLVRLWRSWTAFSTTTWTEGHGKFRQFSPIIFGWRAGQFRTSVASKCPNRILVPVHPLHKLILLAWGSQIES